MRATALGSSPKSASLQQTGQSLSERIAEVKGPPWTAVRRRSKAKPDDGA